MKAQGRTCTKDVVTEMGYYKYLEKNFSTKASEAEQRSRLIRWRQEPAVTRIIGPTNPARARALGYKSKVGFVMLRARIGKGGRHREKFTRGRKPSNYGKLGFYPGAGHQVIVEQRANRVYPNLEVLNSYFIGEDGSYKWFEIILIDPSHPAIIKDKDVKAKFQKRRAYRGLTGAGKKARGLKA